jgi:hypothetical protein
MSSPLTHNTLTIDLTRRGIHTRTIYNNIFFSSNPHRQPEMTHLNCNLIPCTSEQLLPKPVALLFLPLVRQERNDRFRPLQEAVAVAPNRVRGIGFRYRYWIPV